jgi:hypothetical protein
MKTIGYFILLLTTVMNCKPKELKPVEPDGMYAIKEKQTVTVKLDTKNTKIQLLEISEGRCIGRNIVCVWAGVLTVKLTISNADKMPIELSLKTDYKYPEGIAPSDAQIQIDNVPYVVSFEQVDIKKPNEDNIGVTPKENYTIWLRLIKK